MAVALQISPNSGLFIKDPQSTSTGRNILKYSIPLMQELGFEKFTFKKLAESMGSSEISVYRYFENKHKLLLYLMSWYWEWVKYSIAFNIQNVTDRQKKLDIAIRTVIESNRRNPLVEYIDEEKLHAVVLEESEKAYHTKYVDEENKEGFFLTLKSLKSEISQIIQEINPDYPYPNSLASTILTMSASLRFYAHHLPSMSDIKDLANTDDEIFGYLKSLVSAIL
jgi:AcrR family transcriptional regulator